MQTILAIDDSREIRTLLNFDIEEAGYRFLALESVEQAQRLLKEELPDLILLDIYLEGESGISFLKKIKHIPEYKDIPIIMLSASAEEQEIVQALDLGADDYVTKPYIAEVLLARIRTSLRLREKALLLEKLATTDYLTGINNRRQFSLLTHAAISRCQRKQLTLCLAVFDIDYFKSINDQHGHDAGDRALVDFSAVLQETFRPYDIVGRMGGEEFAVCIPDSTIEEAVTACERFRIDLENRNIVIGINKKITITVSIGISTLSENLTFEELIKHADDALYKAKSTGRNKVCITENNVYLKTPDNPH